MACTPDPVLTASLQDSFYKKHTEEEMKLAHQSRFDFDHPDAIDMELFASVRAPSISHAPRIRDVLELGVFRHSAYQTSSHVVKRTFLSIPSRNTRD